MKHIMRLDHYVFLKIYTFQGVFFFFLQYRFTLAINDEVISFRIELINRPINMTD